MAFDYNVEMGWRASSAMDEKLRFVFEYERDEESMRALCERFGISRETGYVWLRRYRQSGPEGLVEVNRAPLRHPNQTASSIEEAVLGLRQAHMTWGPRKLKRILERDQPGRGWPATSTMGEIVKRAGLVVPRKKRRRTEPYTEPLQHAVESNRVWCGDFKGWFKSGDGTRIDPLTITDACSRYLLRSQAVAKTDTERVQAIFEAAFREFGLPWWIRTDNGPPFASSAVGGLSRLAVWWIKLGIVPERIEAGHPEQNGRHDPQLDPLHRQPRQAGDGRRGKGRSVVGSDRLRQSILAERGFEDRLHPRRVRLLDRLAAQQVTAVRVADRQRIDALAIARAKPALEVRAPHPVRPFGMRQGLGIRRRLPPFLARYHQPFSLQ